MVDNSNVNLFCIDTSASAMNPQAEFLDIFTHIPQLLNWENLLLCQHMYFRHVSSTALIMSSTCGACSNSAQEQKDTDSKREGTKMGHDSGHIFTNSQQLF